MNSTKEVAFMSSNGTKLNGRFAFPAESMTTLVPVVVMLTGDGPKGTKSLSWTNMPPMLAEKGIASFLFDFQGLGFSGGERRNLTLSIGLEDMKNAMQQVLSEPKIDKERIGLFGSSFGGNVAILYASSSPLIKAIGLKSPVSFYPDSFYCEYGNTLVDRWKEVGYEEHIGFDIQFYLDAFQYNTYGAATGIKCPCLISHGSADTVVPLLQSKHLYFALINSANKSLRIFEGVGHGYSEPGAWDQMADLFVSWFSTTLI
jgi:uncharacterized protein